MLIGVDLDNTIVCYDEVFHTAAVERGLIPLDVPVGKQHVRDHLRANGKEDAWTELQGHVYGEWIDRAPPFPHVLDFFKACRAADMSVCIVSHRTRQPHRGPQVDLHRAARGWLMNHGFEDPAQITMGPERTHFVQSRAEKIRKIAGLGCTHFIDDLPEFLLEPLFPESVSRILFDPQNLHEDIREFPRFQTWSALADYLL